MSQRDTTGGEAEEETAVEASGLGRRYRRGWALRDCSFTIPAGRVCALVGANGAGKSTLLALLSGLTEPTEGTVRLFGGHAPGSASARPRVAHLTQDKPLYRGFTVAETLRLGGELNPGWDRAAAEEIVRRGGLPLSARVGGLSGGQRARLALALALGRHADLLLLDEPMAELDPVARHELTGTLMAEVAERGTTVVISSHLLAELHGVCDHVLLLAGGRVRLAGDVEDLLAAHRLVTGAGSPSALDDHTVVECRVTGRQYTALIRLQSPARPEWAVSEPALEDVLLAYLRSPDAPPLHASGAPSADRAGVTA
ncbi:ABC transporter ATP-binding protein [Streptomyces capparidis]